MIPFPFQSGQFGRSIRRADGDPNFANVYLLCHADGTAGSTTFTDSSSFARSITPSGGAQVTASSKFGTGALRCASSTDLISVGAASDWSFISNAGIPWTIEGWVSCDNFTTDKNLFSTSNGSTGNVGIYSAIVATSRQVTFSMYRGVASTFVFNGNFGAFPNDSSYHFLSIQSNGGNGLICYVDGSILGTLSQISAYSSGAATAPLKIGGYSTIGTNGANYDDIRVTYNVQRGATVPTAAFPDF